jgi:hypothetical protein
MFILSAGVILMSNYFLTRVVRVLTTVSVHKDGLTLDDLGVKLNILYGDSMIFGSFKDFIRTVISSDRLLSINDTLFISERGKFFLSKHNPI